MGRPKFPGKPSKLVTKKRVSVLNGAAPPPPSPAQSQPNGAAAPSERAAVRQEPPASDNIEPDGDIGLRATINVTKCDAVQVNL